MKNLLTAIRRAPKRTGSLMALALAVLVPAAIFAWGPDRPTYTYDNPAPHVTFNSMVDTPNYGDERNFVRIKEAAGANNTYTDNIDLKPGQEYTVMVYFHNNARSSLNETGEGIAQNAQMRVQMPATVQAGEKARITGFVSADNATPGTVWDEAYGAASNNVALRYVPNSATIYSNGAVDGQKMPDSLYSTGAPLGYDKLDGKLPGCNEYAGWVTFNIKVDQPNFEVVKKVAKKGEANWQDSMTVQPGDEIDYRIHYKNTGTTVQNNVVIKDTLPKGVSYIDGTTHVSNAASNFQWQRINSNEVTRGGLNIGNYAAGGGAYVKFTAKVGSKQQLECGKQTLVNKATAETNNGNKSDTADVVVTVKCDEPEPPKPKPVAECVSLSARNLSRSVVRFDAQAAVSGGATISEYYFAVRNVPTSGPSVDPIFWEHRVETSSTRASVTKDFDEVTTMRPGTYQAQVVVQTSEGQKYGANCTVQFTIKEKPVEPKPIKVCLIDEGRIITIDESEFDESLHSLDLADCEKKPQPPKEEEPTPEVPTELPQTGLASSLLSLAGIGALTASGLYFATSRRLV